MLTECLDGLNIRQDGVYVDVTYGSGGHSQKILENLSNGRLIAFDRDQDVHQNLIHDPRFLFIQQNYRYLRQFLKFNGIYEVDGILADLGISSWQIDRPERGFSIRHDGALDMRMDQGQVRKAEEVINKYAEAELSDVFYKYGEISNARKLAAEITLARNISAILTTEELKKIAFRNAPRGKENQYLARVFQAIRIEVNEELESLRELLIHGLQMLKPGGRFVIISYHSLEDRLVKNYFRTGNFEGIQEKDFYGKLIAPMKPVNRKAIVPSISEIRDNPRSRSAKLRIAEKNR
jgi:16S rRNA (cytosine1402-N4)-methyltransferase